MQHWFTYPNIDPVAFRLGPIAVHWYGLSYLFGFLVVGAWLARPVARKRLGMTIDDIQDFLVAMLAGVLIGGRSFFVLADIVSRHDLNLYLTHPMNIFAVWNGGMGFFGGFLGAVLAGVWFARKHHVDFMAGGDEVVMMLSLPIATTRIVNFINDELWGNLCVPDHPWCILFPAKADGYRYPSQLLECVLDLAVLPILLLVYRRRPPDGVVFWTWVACYGITRSIGEIWRQTDISFGPLTGGQALALPMIVAGIVGVVRSFHMARTTGPLATKT